MFFFYRFSESFSKNISIFQKHAFPSEEAYNKKRENMTRPLADSPESIANYHVASSSSEFLNVFKYEKVLKDKQPKIDDI